MLPLLFAVAPRRGRQTEVSDRAGEFVEFALTPLAVGVEDEEC